LLQVLTIEYLPCRYLSRKNLTFAEKFDLSSENRHRFPAEPGTVMSYELRVMRCCGVSDRNALEAEAASSLPVIARKLLLRKYEVFSSKTTWQSSS